MLTVILVKEHRLLLHWKRREAWSTEHGAWGNGLEDLALSELRQCKHRSGTRQSLNKKIKPRKLT